MGIAEDFKNLGEEILGSFDARINFLGKNIVDTHRFLDNFRKGHKAMGKKLRTDLGCFVDDLSEAVAKMRHKNQQECKAGAQTWKRVTSTMAQKRRNFKNQLAAAKQKAARTR